MSFSLFAFLEALIRQCLEVYELAYPLKFGVFVDQS